MSKVPKLSEIERLKFRKVPKSEIDTSNRRMAENRRKEEERQEKQEEERYKPKTQVIGTCTCSGDIVEVTTYGYNIGPPGPVGGRRSVSRPEEKECFCQSCGIVYNADIVKKRK